MGQCEKGCGTKEVHEKKKKEEKWPSCDKMLIDC